MLNRNVLTAATGHFYLLHQFDLGAHLVAETLSLAVSIATLGAADAISVGLDLVSLGVSIPVASADARSVQNDFLTLYGQLVFGLYQRDFDLRGILVTEDGRPPQIHSWPTVYTSAALNALNNLAGTSFTMDDYMRNPNEIFNAYENLSSTQLDRLVNDVGIYRTQRFNRLNQ